MQRRAFLVGLIATPLGYACAQRGGHASDPARGGESSEGSGWPGPQRPVSYVSAEAPPVGERLVLSANEWRERLTPTQFYILREKGTERPFSGDLEDHGSGVYHCAGCGAPLFRAETKFDSGTGWPSFHTSMTGRVYEEVDATLGMVRTEVLCARCGGHLGHVFPDGPPPTGLRYCINSVSLEFKHD